MSPWLLAAGCLLAALGPCAYGCLRGRAESRLMALLLAQVNTVLLLMVLARLLGRPFYYDLAWILAALSLASAVAYLRMLERWL